MFKNLKIGKKLVISFIVVSLLASISGIVGLAVVLKVDKEYSEALIGNGFVQGDLGRFDTALNRGAALVRDMIYLQDEAELEKTSKELDALKEETNQALADFRVNCQTDAELQQIAIIDEYLPKYQEKREEVIELGLLMQNDEALDIFRNEAQPLLDQCLDAITNLININKTMGTDVSASLSRQSVTFSIVIVLVVVAVFILSVLLGIYVARSISKPIGLCSERLKLLEEGDLHSPVEDAKSMDEAGMMLQSLKSTIGILGGIIRDIDKNLKSMSQGNLDISAHVEYNGDFITIRDAVDHIAKSFNETLGEINQSSEQVSSGADQVASGAQALSQGATEQASSVEELAATINEISDQVNANAKNAQEASKKAFGVRTETAESNQRMQDMLKAMSHISDSSSKISKIMKTIEDIAFQTNILALNAAVEAARAGTAGKGFAVVADEVRNLANKSQEASKTTAVLIEESLKAVEDGTAIADNTARSLALVVDGMQEIVKGIDGISAASEQQAQSISQVTQGVDQVSSVIQTNSATAEESAAASEELSGQAEILKNLVGRFQLKKNM